MAIKWFCVTFIFTIISFKWAFADELKYSNLSEGLKKKLVAISGEEELTYDSLKAIHDDYRHLVIEYKLTSKQEDYKVRFRTILYAFFGEIVRLYGKNVISDESDKTQKLRYINFWLDSATKEFYSKTLANPSELTHKHEIDETWKKYLALKIKLNVIGVLDKTTEDEYLSKAVERLQALAKLIDQTISESDKMSMAIFFIKIYKEIDTCDGANLSEVKNKWNELNNHYFGEKVDTKERYLLLKSELDEVLIRLWTNKDKSNEKNSKFQNDVCEARYLYLALLDEIYLLKDGTDYELDFIIYMTLTHDEIKSTQLRNTEIFWIDENIDEMYEVFIDGHFSDIGDMKPKEYFQKYGPGILTKINQWTEVDDPPAGLKDDIMKSYVVLFLHKMTDELTTEDVPREIFELYEIKNELAKCEMNWSTMAFEKFIRLMGPIQPKLIKRKQEFKDFGGTRTRPSPLLRKALVKNIPK